MKKTTLFLVLLFSFLLAIFGSKKSILQTKGIESYNKAYDYFRKNKFDSAIIHFKNAEKLLRIEKNKNLELVCSLRIIGAYLALNKFENAKLAIISFEDKNKNTLYALHNKLPLAIYYGIKTRYYFDYSEADSIIKYGKLATNELNKIGLVGDNTKINLYNDLGNYYLESNDFKKAKEFYENANSILVSQSKKYFDCKLMARTLLNFGNLQFYSSNYDSAFIFYKKSGEIIQKEFGKNHPQVAMAYSNMGLILEIKCNYEEAIKYYNQSLKIYRQFFGEHHQSVAELYASLGFLYYSKKDYGNAKICYYKEFNIYSKLFGENHPTIGLVYKNLGNLEKEQGNFDNAKILLEKAFKNIKQNYGENHSEIAEILLEMGRLEQSNQVEKSIEIFRKAIKISEIIEGDFSENKGDLLYELAKSYDLLGDSKSCISISDSCINTFTKVFKTKKHPKIIDAIFLISSSKIKEHNYEKALIYCDKGINLSFKNQPNFPENLDSKNILFESSIIKGLQLKTTILRLQKKDPQIGLLFSKYGLLFSQKQLQSLNSNQGQTDILKEISSFCEKGIEFSKQLYEKNKATVYLSSIFSFMESNKANLLKINNKTLEAIKFAGIPKYVIKKEQELKNQLCFLKNEKLYQIENQSNNDKIKNIQNQIFETNEKLNTLKENIKLKYPEYFNLKYESNDINLENFQKKLIKNAIVLEYFETDSGYLLLKIDQKKTELFTIIYHNKITDFDNLIKSIVYEDEILFATTSFNLYNSLIPDGIKKEIKNKSLFIIREGLLQNIPFEVLITEKPKISSKTDWKYLLFQNPIIYNFSAHFILEKRKSSFFPSSKIWAISWLNNENPLIGAKKEINQIKKIFPLRTSLDTALSETDFKNKVSTFDINHIATHAILNDSSPIFSYFKLGKDSINDGKLYAYELYNLHIPAELSCLSACETGIGKDLKGDCQQSLARAFYFAGCKNLLISKWKLPDNSTARLVENFYKNLAKKENKIVALQNAKIDYLQTATRYELSPFYWAGFEIYGNQFDLSINQSFLMCYWELILFSLFLLAIFYILFVLFKKYYFLPKNSTALKVIDKK